MNNEWTDRAEFMQKVFERDAYMTAVAEELAGGYHNFEGSTCRNCEDGPEVGIIRSILPTEADRLNYLPGREGWNLRVLARANRISQKLFSKQYHELSKTGKGERAAKVRRLLLTEGV